MKEKIIEVALDNYFNYGIRSVSMDDLARKLGVSKKTIYKDFRTKENLVEAVISKWLDDLFEQICEISKNSKDPIEEIVKITNKALDILHSVSQHTMYDLKKYYRKIWNKWDETSRMYMYENIRKNFISGIKQGCYRKDLNVEIAVQLYHFRTKNIISSNLLEKSEYELSEMLLESLDIFMRGIATEKGTSLWLKHKRIL